MNTPIFTSFVSNGILNITNIDKAIAVLRRAQNLNMMQWQGPSSSFSSSVSNDIFVKTEAELHACGNRACFAGYVAVSPEWKAFGGRIDPNTGAPVWTHPENKELFYGSDAIAQWLDVYPALVKLVVYGHEHEFRMCIHSDYYGKKFVDVTPDDVIKQLHDIKGYIGTQRLWAEQMTANRKERGELH